MKIGTRITLTTVVLVVATLGLFASVSVRTRRAELAADLERQMSVVGATVRVTLEAAIQDGLFQDVSQLVGRWQEAKPEIGFAYFDLQHRKPGQAAPGFTLAERPTGSAAPSAKLPEGGAEEGPSYHRPPPDPTREARLQRVVIEGDALGAHVSLGGRAVYAHVEPIRDADGQIVGAVELTRDETALELALGHSARSVAYALAGGSLLLALLVWVSTRSGISNPLKRLVEAIDDVTQGDLGRVILRERDDEVGALAERFNEMTASLREAREEILRGVDAKLALEARLRHSDKLATIGQLAAGIAHEVGTPLNVIGGRARSMEKKAGEALRAGTEAAASPAAMSPADVAKNAGIIAAQTQRITRIIQQLLDFARRPLSVRERVDLAAVARDTLEFLEQPLEQARVESALHDFVADGEGAPSAAWVSGTADQLQQVCINLCLNAIQAMPRGGKLELATRALVRRRPGLDVAPAGRHVVLEVADSGVGIPPEDRDRIFDPFYSARPTAPDGRDPGGTGLGLSVSVGIVKDHDGWIEIDDRPGGGTVFRVFLPAEDEPQVVARGEASQPG